MRPHVVGQEELESSIRRRYPHGDAKHGARIIKKSVGMGVGDRVLLSQGYAPNQSKDVYICGLAIVTGGFYDDASADWWTFKHPADIRPVGRRVPKSLLERTLRKSSMLLTLHEVRREQFERLESRLLVPDE